MKFSKTVAQIAVLLSMTLAGPAAAQQAYPNKPIRIITPYAPGGSTSVVARLVGQKLTEGWGQQVIVDNRPGGNGYIGGEALVKAAPDGYTFMLITATHVMTPLLVPAPYDAIKDVTAIASICSSDFVLVVHPSVPAKTLKEFIALAKARPGELNYASSGTGGGTHIYSEMLFDLARVKLQHIPYKGAGQSQIDLIAGQVQVLFTFPVNVLPHITSGKLRALAVSGESRIASLPQVPTLTQSGLPGFDITGWFGLLAPAGTPKEIVDKVSSEIGKIVRMPDIKDKFVSQGIGPYYSAPEPFTALMKADTAKIAKIIKVANIKLEK